MNKGSIVQREKSSEDTTGKEQQKMTVLNSESLLTASKESLADANDPVAIVRHKLARKIKSEGEQLLAKIFNKLDSDGSGTLSIQEFEKLLDALLGRKLAKTPGVAGRVWGSLGTNGHELDQATLIGWLNGEETLDSHTLRTWGQGNSEPSTSTNVISS